jgi:hypothetical protein
MIWKLFAALKNGPSSAVARNMSMARGGFKGGFKNVIE